MGCNSDSDNKEKLGRQLPSGNQLKRTASRSGGISELNGLISSTDVVNILDRYNSLGEASQRLSAIMSSNLFKNPSRFQTLIDSFRPITDAYNIIHTNVTASTAVADLAKTIQNSIGILTSNLFTSFPDFNPMFKALRGYSGPYPPNISAAAKEVDFTLIVEIEYNDGIALFDVLRPSLVTRFLKADTTRKRRDILSHAYDQILDDCKASVSNAVNSSFFRKRQDEIWLASLVLEAIGVLAEHHFAAGQALLMVILDDLIAKHLDFAFKDYISYKNKTNKSDPQKLIEEQSTRTALAFLPVYSAWQHFDKANDPIPLEFSRHAIAHRPTKRQFSKTNAAQGLLCVTSLMDYCFEWYAR